jgi:hypothetical protein
MTADKLSLHRKLAQVMYEAERIPKNGTAPREMGGYKFVQVGDAADYIRKALAEKVITMMPTAVHVVGQQDRPTKSGGNMTTVDLLTEWTLTDGESGESITIMSFGSGADGGDKYSGKASTSAMKYALLSGFLLSTGDDTEGSKPEPDKAGAKRQWDDAHINEAPRPELERRTSPDGLIGTVSKGNTPMSDLGLHLQPDGSGYLGFKLKNGKSAYECVATTPLAEQIADALLITSDTLEAQTVTVWGRIEMVPFVKGEVKREYARIVMERLQTADWTVPAQVAPGQVEAFDA